MSNLRDDFEETPEKELEEARRKMRGRTPERTTGKPWNRGNEGVFQSVFGKQTLLTLYKLANDGNFTELYGEFNSGKEANVFVGKDSAGRFVAVKIYRIEASDFGNMIPYLKGDPRFENVGPSKREIVFAWTKKEFSNLSKFEG
ncbi:MAG: RIO1 family regulatory kinase/ATPase, partial [archaeon]